MTTGELARHLRAVRKGEIAFDPSLGNEAEWVSALYRVIRRTPNLARKLAALLLTAYPANPSFRLVAEIARQTTLNDWKDDLKAEIQTVLRPDCDTALIVCCSLGHHLGAVPLGLAHRWFSQLPVSLIYLRDFSLTAWCEDYAGRLERLRAATHGLRRLMCLGFSSGGYAALRFGADLGAEKILLYSAPTSLEPHFLAEAGLAPQLEVLFARHIGDAIDLRPNVLRAHPRPQIKLWYGKDSAADRIQAENLTGLADIEAIAGCAEHNVVRDLILQQRFRETLDWLA